MDEYLLVTSEQWNDIAEVAEERKIDLVYSHEDDGIHIYSHLEMIEETLWAREFFHICPTTSTDSSCGVIGRHRSLTQRGGRQSGEELMERKGVRAEMDKPWKAFERRISQALGASRALNHLSGGGDKSDVDHPIFSIDCKLQKTFSLRSFDELREDARKNHKIPVLVYRKPKERRTYAVMDFETFRSLAKGAGWIQDSDTEP